MFQVFIAKSALGSCLQSTSHPFHSSLPGSARNKTQKEKKNTADVWSLKVVELIFIIFLSIPSFCCLHGAECFTVAHNL